MTDPIQAAIEEAEDWCPCAHLEHRGVTCCGDGTCRGQFCQWPGHAAIRSLAEIVREYGHAPRCCCDPNWNNYEAGGLVQHGRRDPRCLPESREEKP